jgi:hypothetical protein
MQAMRIRQSFWSGPELPSERMVSVRRSGAMASAVPGRTANGGSDGGTKLA